MQPTLEQVEQIQTALIKEYAAITFYKQGTDPKSGYWYLTADAISEVGKQNDAGDPAFYRDKDIDAFLKFAEDGDLVAMVNLDGSNAFEEQFTDWAHLARYMGITDLVVLSTKVPKTIAKKFEYYATKEGTQSEKLRRLVYDYVISCIKENAEKDVFR